MTVATRGVRSHVYYGMTRSLCRTCRQVVDARILFEDGRAWLDKFCLDHGAQRALAGSSAEWYADALKFAAPVVPPSRPATRVRRGCPLDCGPCPSHAAAFEICVLPALRGGRAEIPAAADGAVVRLAADDVLRRPELPETCRKAGFRRAVACAGSLDDARALAGAGIDMVLSVEDAAPDLLEVVGLLQEGGAIVTVRAKVPPRPEILRRLLDAVLSGPRAFSLELQVAPPTTIPDVHEEIRRVTEGRIAGTDFVPSPLAHPHCMSVCAVIRLDDGGFLPFVRCASREAVFELLKGRLGPDPDEPLARFLREAAPSASRRAAGAIVLHASMDAEHFDVSRSMRCPVAVLGPDGAAIPACSWGVLHREAGR